MADPIIAPAGTGHIAVVSAPEPVQVAAPVVAAPVVPEPVVAPVAAQVEIVAEPEIKAPPSMLAEAVKPVEPAKPAEPVVETKPVEKPAEIVSETVTAPVVYDFKVPETIKAEPDQIGKFTEILGETQVSPETGQKLMDLYATNMAEAAKTFQKHQVDAWHETNAGWQAEVMADPEIGGNRHKTAMLVCGAMIEEYGSPGLRDALILTGAGNHPDVIRFVHRIGLALGEGRPVVQGKPAAQPKTRAQRVYGS